MHPGRVVPDEERLVGLVRLVDEAFRGGQELAVDRLHPLGGERAGVLALLLAPGAEARVLAGLVEGGGVAVQHAARAELALEARVGRVVDVLRLLLGVEVVEVAEELVEAVHRRQVLVAVAEMVLAELAGGVAERLEQLGDGRVRLLRPSGAPGRPTLVRPVRTGDCPVTKAARPAVQLCCPYQSVNRAPSRAIRSMLGVL